MSTLTTKTGIRTLGLTLAAAQAAARVSPRVRIPVLVVSVLMSHIL